MMLQLSTCKIQHNFRNFQFYRKINFKKPQDYPLTLRIYS
ncbi:hypothetical protein HMPREF9442_01089 [Paraprevotella xylaniphila YIT 11841]|uniref:Uncharacterized protein n=1 Tax=Paraprevotella xylaniphila YIT 11841 TaxID=762982 RepID=F3QSD2_9BACT|nr:hypothetical protein HMPREF9442_01089 [Paraprevotella xylaniphila YIT 11841]